MAVGFGPRLISPDLYPALPEQMLRPDHGGLDREHGWNEINGNALEDIWTIMYNCVGVEQALEQSGIVTVDGPTIAIDHRPDVPLRLEPNDADLKRRDPLVLVRHWERKRAEMPR